MKKHNESNPHDLATENFNFKAVLFDLDGTLLDTLDDIGESLNRAFEKTGFSPVSREIYKKYVGEGVTKLLMNTLPEEKRDPETVDACLAAFIEDYRGNWNVKSKPYDGIPKMLDRLSARGVKMAVLSNKTHDLTQKCVSELLPDWDFEIVFGLRDGFPRKPDPGSALEVAERLNLPPADFLYLGDTGIDMKTAVAASMFPVGVLWGFRPGKELREHGARALIDHPRELEKFYTEP